MEPLMSNVSMVNRNECTGCGACENICPQNCICLEYNQEGFLEPLIDQSLCIDCGYCIGVCPSMLSANKDSCIGEVKVYSAWSKSKEILQKSTSGGVFSSLAEEVINKDGVVIGAALQDDMSLKHILINKVDQIGKLQGSKYIQSHINNIYSIIEQCLEKERFVLFSGLPCQVAGLNSYLQYKKGKKYENLINCQLICFGVPSNIIFREYITILERKYKSKVKSYEFRLKSMGWKNYGVKATFKNKKQYHSKGNNDPFMIGFLNALYLRSCCFVCKHKGFPINADIALGDFWNVDKYDDSLTGIDGISLVVIQTEKGNDLFNSIKDNLIFKQQTTEIAIRCNPSLVTGPQLTSEREEYFKDYLANGYSYCMKKYTNPLGLYKSMLRSLKCGIKMVLRWILRGMLKYRIVSTGRNSLRSREY